MIDRYDKQNNRPIKHRVHQYGEEFKLKLPTHMFAAEDQCVNYKIMNDVSNSKT